MKKVLVFVLLFTGSSLMARSGKTNELRIAMSTEFESLHPVLNTMIVAMYVQDATFRPLVAVDRNGKLKSFLLAEIPTLENKKARILKRNSPRAKTGGHRSDVTADGLEVQLEFLKQAQWGDGVPVTCHDLAATWEIGRHDSVSAPNRQEYLNIEEIRIEASNPKKCTVVFAVAKSDFMMRLPRPIPAHLELPLFNKYKSTPLAYEKNTLYLKEPSNPGLYNGPYRVSEIKLGSHVVLVPNSKFWGQKPAFEKVIFKFITNTSAMETQLLTGNVDLLSSSAFSFDQALAFEKRIQKEKLPFRVIFQPGILYAHLDFNLDHFALRDKKIRQALSYALNRKEIVKAFFEDRQPMALSFATSFDDWYTEDPKFVKTYEYNSKKAAALLEEAGWKLGPDGFRSKNGKRLSFLLSSAVDIKLNEMIQTYIQSAWKKIGVEVVIRNYPLRVLIGEIMKKRNFDVGLGTWGLNRNSSQFSMLHSSQIPTAENNYTGNNRPGWKNSEADKLIEQADLELDQKKKTALMKNLVRIYTEELPAMPLYYRSSNSVIPIALQNYFVSPDLSSEYLEIETWKWN